MQETAAITFETETAMDHNRNPWDDHAERYRELIAEREHEDPAANPIVSRMLELLGDLHGRAVLDACCGEGFFSRILAAGGAQATPCSVNA